MQPLRRFDKELDTPHVEAWLRMRGLVLGTEQLPEIGVIVPYIAVGFLRKCEGGYGLLDSYLTHPLQSPEDRNEALNLITQSLIAISKEEGITKLISLTQEPNISTRAQVHGFKPVDWDVLIRQSEKA